MLLFSSPIGTQQSFVESTKYPVTSTWKSKKIKLKYKTKEVNEIPPIKEILKKKLQLKAQKTRPYKKRCQFYRQNKLFQMNLKKFYREIGKAVIEV